MIQKSKKAFRTISEAADELGVPQHVLRFWETKFSHVKPMKRGGNRRYYRPEDIALLIAIKHHLYDEGQTIKGVQKLIRDQGVKAFVEGTEGAGPEETPAELEPAEAPAVETSGPESKPAEDREALFDDQAEPKKAEPEAPGEKRGEDDGAIRVSKDLVKALVNDLRALRNLIDRLPD